GGARSSPPAPPQLVGVQQVPTRGIARAMPGYAPAPRRQHAVAAVLQHRAAVLARARVVVDQHDDTPGTGRSGSPARAAGACELGDRRLPTVMSGCSTRSRSTPPRWAGARW